MHLVEDGVMGPRQVGASLEVKREATAEVHGISTERAGTDEVALDTAVAGVLEHPEIVEPEVRQVVMRPQGIEAIVPSAPLLVAGPLTGIEVETQMAVFPLGLIVGGPRTVAAGEAHGPCAVETCLHTEVRCQRSGIDEVIAHS